MCDELVDLGDTHFTRVAFVVVEDVFADPEDIRFFGTRGILFETDLVTVLVEQFFPLWGRCGFRCLFHFLAPKGMRLYNQIVIYRALYSHLAVMYPNLGCYTEGCIKHSWAGFAKFKLKTICR